MGKLQNVSIRRPKRHRKRDTTSCAAAVHKKEVDLKPEDFDTQPLPRKLRLLLNTSVQKHTTTKSSQHKGSHVVLHKDKSTDKCTDEVGETHLHTELQSSPTRHAASVARKRHLKLWKEKHKKRQQRRKEDINSHNHSDEVRFGEVVCRPPELSAKRVKLQHLTFVQRVSPTCDTPQYSRT